MKSNDESSPPRSSTDLDAIAQKEALLASVAKQPAIPKQGLKRLAIGAAKLEMVAHILGQVLRFASGLILSRLLFPEAFGQSVIVGAVGGGLSMISNVGVHQSIVQSPRGDEQAFLNTGWTVASIRGAVLWLLACLLAFPLAFFLNDPMLLYLVPVGCLGTLIGGFASTSLITLRRHLDIRPLVTLEVLGQLLSLALNMAFAWMFRSVWSLIASTLIVALFNTVASHFLKVGYRNRFQWDPSAWREMYALGRWVQASSALSFTSSQADRFLMVRYVDMAALGIYNYAGTLADSISSAATRIAHGVLFPVLSQINRERPADLVDTFYRVRLRVDVITLLPIGAVAAMSQPIVDLLFDPRYAAAGWMLQALCIRAAMSCMLGPVETFLFATGNTRYGFYRDLARSVWVLLGIPLAWHLGGLQGLVWVVALSEIPAMAVLWTAFLRMGHLRLRRELVGPIAFAAGAGSGLALLLLFSVIFA